MDSIVLIANVECFFSSSFGFEKCGKISNFNKNKNDPIVLQIIRLINKTIGFVPTNYNSNEFRFCFGNVNLVLFGAT